MPDVNCNLFTTWIWYSDPQHTDTSVHSRVVAIPPALLHYASSPLNTKRLILAPTPTALSTITLVLNSNQLAFTSAVNNASQVLPKSASSHMQVYSSPCNLTVARDYQGT